MKKLFLLAVMAMMAIAVQADEEEFVVTSGDFNVVRQPGKTGRLEVDFTKAKVGNLSTMEITDQTFMDYLAANDQKVFKKWSEYQEEAIETFMERWNDAKKKVIKLTKKDTPDYIIKINAAQLDPGNSGAATWSWNKRGGGIIISGTLEVIDTEVSQREALISRFPPSIAAHCSYTRVWLRICWNSCLINNYSL